jgi:hypothetical protein
VFILKHTHNFSDEAMCDRWVESPYLRYFCGEVVFKGAISSLVPDALTPAAE